MKIEPAGEGSYRVSARAPAGGEARAIFVLPFDEKDIEIFLLKIGQPKRLGTRGLILQPAQPALDFGNQLFNAVFKDDVRDVFVSARNEADRKDLGLRLRLRLEGAPELADLPWEYLYDSPDFLALSTNTPLVRYIDLPSPPRPLAVDLPLRILVTVSSPHGLPVLDIETEKAKIQNALAGLIKGSMLELEFSRDATLQTLQRTLRQARSQGRPFHAWHFIGHGVFDPSIQSGQLALCNAGGMLSPTDGFQLGTLFKDYPEIRLVLLNACEGARSSRQDPFAGVATALVERGIPAVIGMQFEISDEAAIVFSEGFYTALVDGLPVDAALTEARRSIFFMPNWVEWATPVLFMRSQDGVLFKIQRPSTIQLADAEAAQKAEQERLEQERAEADRIARERAEAERLAAEKAEAKRLENEWAEADRVARDLAATELLAAQKAEQERLAEEERLAAETAEQERLAAQKAEQERLAEEERLAAQKAEQERLAAQPTEQERLAREKAEAERKAREEDERLAHQQKEQGQLTREQAVTEGELVVALSVGAEGAPSDQPGRGQLSAGQMGTQAAGARIFTERLPRWAMWAGLLLVGGLIIIYVATRQGSPNNLARIFSPLRTEEASLPIVVPPQTETPSQTSTPPSSPHALVPTGESTDSGVLSQESAGRVAFASTREGNSDIYVMNADGSELTRLTDDPAADIEPAWSPDGTRIAFLSVRDGNAKIYMMNADGSELTWLANDSETESSPAWSPDGARIAFESLRDGPSNIYVMNADGSKQTRLTDNPYSDSRPAWSPDGSRIVFDSLRDGNIDIYVMNADGSEQIRLTNDPAPDLFPAWSPDGTRIAFVSDRGNYYDIYVINADGSEQTRLTEDTGLETMPVWSPDGKRIAFDFRRGYNNDIYVMNADGSDLTRLTVHPEDDIEPTWSPDGAHIAFVSRRDDFNRDIYIMNADGSEQTRLTEDPATDYQPTWQPQ